MSFEVLIPILRRGEKRWYFFILKIMQVSKEPIREIKGADITRPVAKKYAVL